MSINLENMAHIYKAMLPNFITLQEEAQAYGVTLEVSVSPDGRISFTSKEITDEKVFYNTISQGQNHVGESCFSYKLKNKKTKKEREIYGRNTN